MTQGPFRVLIVEDEPLIGWMLEDIVGSMGMEVAGPFRTTAEANDYLRDFTPEVALLDVNLLDGDVFPVADALQETHVPMIFHTANLKCQELKARYHEAEVIMKPSDPATLQRVIGALQDRIPERSH